MPHESGLPTHRTGWWWTVLALAAPAQATCVESMAGLRALLAQPSLPLQWTETGMDDGRPLLLSIEQRGNVLHLSFVKSGEGLWADGEVQFCRRGTQVEARLDAQRIRLGPSAPWVLRLTMASGAVFVLTPLADSGLRVETAGWNGRFAARP